MIIHFCDKCGKRIEGESVLLGRVGCTNDHKIWELCAECYDDFLRLNCGEDMREAGND